MMLKTKVIAFLTATVAGLFSWLKLKNAKLEKLEDKNEALVAGNEIRKEVQAASVEAERIEKDAKKDANFDDWANGV